MSTPRRAVVTWCAARVVASALLVASIFVGADFVNAGQRLSASDGSPLRGRPVISGDRLATGVSPVKVFRRVGTVFVEEQILPDDGTRWTGLDGDVLVGGAILDDDVGIDAGAAIVYRFDGSVWAFEQKLYASDPLVLGYFGQSPHIQGDEMLIGSNPSGEPGAVYVFRFDGVSWVQEQRLSASDEVPGDANGFGSSIARSGDVLAVRGGVGVYVFRWNGSSWLEEQAISVSAGSIALGENTLFVGRGFNPPEIVVYRWNGGTWMPEDTLDPPYERGLEVRGLAVHDDVLLAGFRASFPPEAGGVGAIPGEEAGFAAVYGWDGAGWLGGVLIPPPDLLHNGAFGQDVALTDEYLALAANNPGKGTTATVYVFPFGYSCGTECFFDFPIEATKLNLVKKPSGKEVLSFVSKDRYMAFPAQDAPPSSEGATLEVFSASEGSAALDLPAGPEWELKSSKAAEQYFYKNKDAPAGPSPVKKTKFRAGRTKNLQIVGADAGLPMAVPHGEVALRWTSGSLRMCALFDASTVKRDLPGLFVAKGSEPWSTPDCADASMP